jgi:outer membrane biosynthesis protein TonB
MCQYTTRNGNICKRDGQHKIGKKTYCLRHFKQLSNENAQKKVNETKEEKKPNKKVEIEDEVEEKSEEEDQSEEEVKPKRKPESKPKRKYAPKPKPKEDDSIEIISESSESESEESPKKKEFNSLMQSIRSYRNTNEIARNMVQEAIYGPKTKGKIFG